MGSHQNPIMIAAANYSIASDEVSENLLKYVTEDTRLQDVTLVCDDGQHIRAHKIVLSARSPLFKEVLNGERDLNPFIYFCEFQKSEIETLMEFLYRGSTVISEENMRSFFRIAKLLKIDGVNVDPVTSDTSPVITDNEDKLSTSHENFDSEVQSNIESDSHVKEFDDRVEDIKIKDDRISFEKCDETNETFSKINGLWECNICGRTFIRKNHVTTHVLIHNEEPVPCPECTSILKTKDSLKKHIQLVHTSQRYTCDACGKADMTPIQFKHHKYNLKHKTRYSCVNRTISN